MDHQESPSVIYCFFQCNLLIHSSILYYVCISCKLIARPEGLINFKFASFWGRWRIIIFHRSSCLHCSSVSKEPACSVGELRSIPGLGRSPGEEMATHSSILAWKSPWTEEPGRLHSITRVRHDLPTKPPAHHFNFWQWVIVSLFSTCVSNNFY